MITTKTPFRVSLFGGGSDIESFYSQSPGAVLSFTINKYMYLSSHDFFEKDKIRAKYSRTETVNNPEDLQHPIMREVFLKFKVKGGLEVSSIADIPAGSGMGSSSCFTVGLLQNLYARQSRFISKARLAEEAAFVEIQKLNEPIGKQDQYAAAFGGINIFRFNTNGFVEVEKINLTNETLKDFQTHMLLFYTGQTRATSTVLAEQKVSMKNEEKLEIMKLMVKSVDSAQELLLKGEWKALGELLHQNWFWKKQMVAKISNPEIDEAYSRAMEAGAWGGKLLGAGGGGFLLFFCPPDRAKAVIQNLGLRQLTFRIEQEGSKVIYFDEDSVEVD